MPTSCPLPPVVRAVLQEELKARLLKSEDRKELEQPVSHTQVFLERWLTPRLGQKRYTIALEHSALDENQKAIKDNIGM